MTFSIPFADSAGFGAAVAQGIAGEQAKKKQAAHKQGRPRRLILQSTIVIVFIVTILPRAARVFLSIPRIGLGIVRLEA